MDVETISLALRSLPLWPHAISEEDLVLLHLFFLFFFVHLLKPSGTESESGRHPSHPSTHKANGWALVAKPKSRDQWMVG